MNTLLNYLKTLWTALKGDQAATKHLLKSKTIWFNVLTLAASVAGFFPPKWAAIILPVANIGLRIVTTQGITFLED